MTDVVKEYQEKAKKVIDGLRHDLGGIRTSRPNAALVEDIKVNYYDRLLPLKQLGSIGIAPPREIHIQAWDAGAVTSIVKAIESSSLGLTANADGSVIRMFLPELSEERREELIKHVKRTAEEHRIQIRHTRDEANKAIQKMFDEHTLGEDQKFKSKEVIQKETEKMNETVDSLVEAKVKEIHA